MRFAKTAAVLVVLLTAVSLSHVSVATSIQLNDKGCRVYCISSIDYSSKSACPCEQPCFTLYQFVVTKLPKINTADTKCIRLNFLSGIHFLNVSMDLDKIHRVVMKGVSDIPEIQLQADNVTFYNIQQLKMTYLAIYGDGRYTLTISGRQQDSKVVITHTTVDSTALQVQPNTEDSVCPKLIISQCTFSNGMIEVKDCTTTSEMNIRHSIFQSGHQAHTIAICSSNELTNNVTVTDMENPIQMNITDVTISDSSRDMSGRGLNVQTLCNHSSDFESVSIYVSDVIVILNIKNCHFSQTRGIALSGINCTHSTIRIDDNSTFSHYTQGVFVFSGSIDGSLIVIKDSHMTDNSVRDARISTAAVLNVNPQAQYNVSTRIEMVNCLVANNSDEVGNLEIILVHACSNVVINDSNFVGNHGTAIGAVESVITFSGEVLFDKNIAQEGGALALKSCFIYITDYTTINFTNNNATQFGGAIYIENPLFELQNENNTRMSCFYQPVSENFTNIQLVFRDNFAEYGGNSVYGTSINNYCKVERFNFGSQKLDDWHSVFDFEDKNRPSLVSSKATRVCICKYPAQSQCDVEEKIFNNFITAVYPGQPFNISVVLVGAQFGTTVGLVFASLVPSNNNANSRFGNRAEAIQTISDNDNCTNLTYTIWSSGDHVTMSLSAMDNAQKFGETAEEIRKAIDTYSETNVVPISLLTTPLYFNITLKDCPLGFKRRDHQYCSCLKILSNYTDVHCTFDDGTGYVSRSDDVWIGLQTNGTRYDRDVIMVSKQCPFDHCKHDEVSLDLESDANFDFQCAFNHTGTLCGGCLDNHSLAIGSSHCVSDCHGNKGITLLIFFVAAGPLLYVFIAVLSLTLSKGLINSLLFYANVVWIYQNALFPNTDEMSDEICKRTVQVLKVFVAWLNLDFGIETCFINGLNAFWKSILQYAFPIYIWLIARVVYALCDNVKVKRIKECCPKLAKLTADPAEVLVTLVLLSYTKLIRNIKDGLTFSRLSVYNAENETQLPDEWVWSLDGNNGYLKDRHIAVFLISLLALVVTLLYTFYILGQGLKHNLCSNNNEEDEDQIGNCNRCNARIRSRISRIFNFPLPLQDAHFVAYNSKHSYWLGLMLLARILLLITFTVISEIAPEVNLPILSTTVTLLLFYTSWNEIHDGKLLKMLLGFSLGNLIFASGGIQYADLVDCDRGKAVVICISTGMALIQFIGIVCYSMVKSVTRDDTPPPPNADQGGTEDSDRYQTHLGT